MVDESRHSGEWKSGLQVAISKTEIVMLSKRKITTVIPCGVENGEIYTERSAKYLGVTLDCKLTFWDHISGRRVTRQLRWPLPLVELWLILVNLYRVREDCWCFRYSLSCYTGLKFDSMLVWWSANLSTRSVVKVEVATVVCVHTMASWEQRWNDGTRGRWGDLSGTF